jgi:hypothetical protein
MELAEEKKAKKEKADFDHAVHFKYFVILELIIVVSLTRNARDAPSFLCCQALHSEFLFFLLDRSKFLFVNSTI